MASKWYAQDTWDGTTMHSRAAAPIHHEAVCMACGRTVLPTNQSAWIAAIRTLRCEICRGSMLVAEQDLQQRRLLGEDAIAHIAHTRAAPLRSMPTRPRA
jgi:DNA-directed RNA polymerase subunit RPC12/RpoP